MTEKFPEREILLDSTRLYNSLGPVLSKGELEVLALYIRGYKTRDIARMRNTTKPTISTQLRRLRQKLHVNSDVELVAICMDEDIIKVADV